MISQKKLYTKPVILNVGDVTAVTLGSDLPGENDPITMRKVEAEG